MYDVFETVQNRYDLQLMNYIFLIGAVQSFFFAAILYGKTTVSRPHRVLTLFFTLIGIILLNQFLEIRGIVFAYPHLLGITYTLPILIGPILYYYTLILTEENKPRLAAFFSRHGIPFIVCSLYFLFNYYFLPADEKLEFYRRQTEGQTLLMVYVTEFFLNVSVPFYSVLSLIKLKKHLNRIKSRYSFTEEINLKWLSVILLFFIGISAAMIITNILSDIIPVFSVSKGDNIMYGSVALAILFIGYYGIKQKAIYPEGRGDSSGTTPARYAKSGFQVTGNDPNLMQLINIMESEKLYRNSKLSLHILAGKTGLTENNISQLINEGLKKNFYDFVNEYRVNEVKRIIKDRQHDHLTLLGIAIECGFNSKSTFNSIFKKHTGMTPSQYKKSISG